MLIYNIYLNIDSIFLLYILSSEFWLDTSPGVAGLFSSDGSASLGLGGFVSVGNGSLSVVDVAFIGLIGDAGSVLGGISSGVLGCIDSDELGSIGGDVLSGVSRNVGSSIGGEIGSGVLGDVGLRESDLIEMDTGIVEDNLVIEMTPNLVLIGWWTIMIIRSVKSKALDGSAEEGDGSKFHFNKLIKLFNLTISPFKF